MKFIITLTILLSSTIFYGQEYYGNTKVFPADLKKSDCVVAVVLPKSLINEEGKKQIIEAFGKLGLNYEEVYVLSENPIERKNERLEINKEIEGEETKYYINLELMRFGEGSYFVMSFIEIENQDLYQTKSISQVGAQSYTKLFKKVGSKLK